MEKVTYNHTDVDAIKDRFSNINPETIDRLCLWLEDNSSEVVTKECYDSQSGWHGVNFFIGMADLSCNGYCLSSKNIDLFISGGQDPMWYYFYQPEFNEAKKWQEENR